MPKTEIQVSSFTRNMTFILALLQFSKILKNLEGKLIWFSLDIVFKENNSQEEKSCIDVFLSYKFKEKKNQKKIMAWFSLIYR